MQNTGTWIGLEIVDCVGNEGEEGRFYFVEEGGCLLHNLRELCLAGFWVRKGLNTGIFVMLNSGKPPEEI